MTTTDEITKLIDGEFVDKQSEGQACLILLKGFTVDLSRSVWLNSNTLTIGRNHTMALRLTDTKVSRKHAIIQRIDERQFLLTDQNSRNGTWVNSQRIESKLLEDQDIIAIGDNLLKFVAGDSPELAHYEELHRLVDMDNALQVFNKSYFLTKLNEELTQSRVKNTPLSLVMIDIDHFKQLNDQYGHLAGDAALLKLTETIKNRIRRNDIFCRYGGEEFAVILPRTHPEQALTMAEDLRTLIAGTPVNYGDQQIYITVSLGISALIPKDFVLCFGEELIAKADTAMYQAKRSGRNKVILFSNLKAKQYQP